MPSCSSHFKERKPLTKAVNIQSGEIIYWQLHVIFTVRHIDIQYFSKKASVYIYMTWHAHLNNESFICKCFTLKDKIDLGLFNYIWTFDSTHNSLFALHLFWITQLVKKCPCIYHLWLSWPLRVTCTSCLQNNISIPKRMVSKARDNSPLLVTLQPFPALLFHKPTFYNFTMENQTWERHEDIFLCILSLALRYSFTINKIGI